MVRTFSPEEVFRQKYKTPSGEVVRKCFLEGGQSWIVEKGRRPEGFCGWAWEDIRKDRYLLTFGGDIPDAEKGVVFVSCSDGKRPVVFKLERLES